MIISADLKNSIKIVGLFTLQLYRITTGTLLSLFIPQKCEIDVCNIQDNIDNRNYYDRFTLSINMISLFAFLINYMVELKREYCCIKYLDIDYDIPDNSLKEIIVKDKYLDKKMDRLNKLYYYTSMVTTLLYVLNILVSMKRVEDNYYNSSTYTTFITFVLLISLKLYNSMYISYYSVKHDKMMSAFLCEFTSYNVLDEDYIQNKPKNRP